MGYHFYKDPDFNFRVQCLVGMAPFGVAEPGEVFTALEQIRDNSDTEWFRTFLALAQRIEGIAQECEQGGHTASARAAYLRASSYYAAAVDGLVSQPDTPELLPTFRKHRECWDTFAALTAPAMQPVEIPYEDTTLPGFFYPVDGSGAPRPTVVITNGSDGAITAVWDMASAAHDRGYNVLLYDGPGQQSMLFERNTSFRPDWEAVVTPIVDYLLTRPDVDADQLVLSGLSQAGYWVPRALAFEHRFAAAAADPGVVDVSTSWTGHLPQPMIDQLDSGDAQGFDQVMEMATKASPQLRKTWWFRSRPYGSEDPFTVFSDVRKYTVKDVAKQITTPLFISSPEGEQFWPGQSEELAHLVGKHAHLVQFTAAEGADMHCEPMARSLYHQRMFDWLDEQLKR